MDALKDRKSCTKRFLQRLLLALYQLVIVLAVWEFLRSSTEPPAADTVNVRTRRFVNPTDCFHIHTQGDTLRLSSIMSRASKQTTKEAMFVLNVDIVVGNIGSGSLILYPAGTAVTAGVDDGRRDEQVWSLEYFEYNDYVVDNYIINNDFPNQEQIHGAVPEHTNTLNQAVKNKNVTKAGNISNESNTTQKTPSANPSENLAIDVMLLEDEMLKVKPHDQLEQQQIMQVIRKTKSDGSLLRKRALLLKGKTSQMGTSHDWSEQVSNRLNNGQNKTEVNFNENNRSKIQQNVTTDDLLAWPDVVLDEASEPLYTDKFLERVQNAKSELYTRSKLYGHSLKEKVRKYYILNNDRACSEGKKVDIVYLIHSQPHRQQHRQLIRETIVKSSLFRPFNIAYVFLLGKTRLPQIQEDLRHESKLYEDIVQGDFEDKFETNVWKGLMGMRWVLQHCRNVNFVLKINDDVFVDTDKLLRGLIPASANIIGKRAMVCSLKLDKSNTSSNFNFTTPYCDGFAVLMTRHLLCSIIAASHQIRVPSVEDYYLYGVLPFVIGGVQVYNVSGNLGFQKDQVRSLSCFQGQPDRCSVVATQSQPDRFIYFWNIIGSRHWKPEGWSGLWDLQADKSYFS